MCILISCEGIYCAPHTFLVAFKPGLWLRLLRTRTFFLVDLDVYFHFQLTNRCLNVHYFLDIDKSPVLAEDKAALKHDAATIILYRGHLF